LVKILKRGLEEIIKNSRQKDNWELTLKFSFSDAFIMVPNLLEVVEHLQIKDKSWEHYDGQH
jgi:general stress protein 26